MKKRLIAASLTLASLFTVNAGSYINNNISAFAITESSDFENFDWMPKKMDEYVKFVSENSSVMGDMNSDGSFNIMDIVLLQKWLLCADDMELSDQQTVDLCKDGVIDVFDLCIMKNELLKSMQVKHDKTVDSFVPVAELFFSELDKGTIKVGDIIDNDEFKALAGADSEVYKNSSSSYNYTPELKPSEGLNIEYLLEIVSEDDPLYAFLTDTEKLDSLSNDELKDMLTNAVPNWREMESEKILSPAALENLKALFDSYEFVYAYILDNDTIIIDNGTGFLLNVEGIIITRNSKNFDNYDEINVPEKFYYDGDVIHVYKKAEGYDNVYHWSAGT
ncbi:MAG: dockerin type I repeat-containing protein [Oscillospiraceae bacterium]